MKSSFDVVVVVPVGPNNSVDFITGTILRYDYFAKSSYKVIFTDDLQQGIGKELTTLFPDADIITTKKAISGWADYILLWHWHFAGLLNNINLKHY